MTKFEKLKLKEICEFKYGKNLPADIRVEGKYPVYGSSNVVSYHKDYLVKGPGIIVGRKGTVGKVQYSNENFFPIDTTFYLKHYPKKVDLKFLYYLLKVVGLKNMNSDAAVPGLNRSAALNLTVNLPPLFAQKKIEKILSNYDDLIEINLKLIKSLEEAAKLTYEEWFLRFKIDGKKLEINPETKIPFGWKKIKIDNYCDVISKGPSLNYDIGSSPGVPVLNQSCVRNGEIELDKVLFAKKLKEEKSSSYLRINDVLINSMGKGTLGRVSKNVSIDEKMIIHNCITYMRSKEIYSQYILYYFISLHQSYFESIASGSTDQLTLNIGRIFDLSISVPDKDIIDKFDMIASKIWIEIGVLKKQNKILREARDILLPRLMTGMIDVDNLDVVV